MLKSLNDKYTRFLTPSMYTAIYATATGDVAATHTAAACGRCGSPAPRGQKHVDAMRTFAVGPSSKQAASSSPISHEPRYNVMYFEVIETALARGTAVSTVKGW